MILLFLTIMKSIRCEGSETFYDEDRYLREWETKEEALEWARANLPYNEIEE